MAGRELLDSQWRSLGDAIETAGFTWSEFDRRSATNEDPIITHAASGYTYIFSSDKTGRFYAHARPGNETPSESVRVAGLLTIPGIAASIALSFGLAILQGQQRFHAFNALRMLPVVTNSAAIAVAFLAGTASSPMRVFLTGIVIGLIEKWSSMFISVRWTETVVFIILLGYLVVKSLQGTRFATRLRLRTA